MVGPSAARLAPRDRAAWAPVINAPDLGRAATFMAPAAPAAAAATSRLVPRMRDGPIAPRRIKEGLLPGLALDEAPDAPRARVTRPARAPAHDRA